MSEIKSGHYPYLSDNIVSETPKAIFAFFIITVLYVFIYKDFIPVPIMLGWLVSVIIFLSLRFWNATKFKKSNSLADYKKHTFLLLLICMYSSLVWGASSLLGVFYAPPAYGDFSLVMIILIICAAVFTLAHFRKIFLLFSIAMISPQVFIFIDKGIHNGTVEDISISIICMISIPFVFLFSKSINDTRLAALDLNIKLEKAVLEIKTLKEIIPICSYCNNIRDDEGSWEQMEHYISTHSDSEFSHGICPDCYVKVRKESGLTDKRPMIRK